MPNGLEVYLEDKETGEFSNITQGSYKVTCATSVNGTGRFYIHTSLKALSTSMVPSFSGVSILNTATNDLIINGVYNKANLQVFMVLDKQTFNNSIKSKVLFF